MMGYKIIPPVPGTAPPTGGGLVTFPTQTVVSGNGSSATLTLSYTLPATTNGVVYVGVGFGTPAPPQSITAVTFNAVAMALVDSKVRPAGGAGVYLWRIKQASLPAPGTYDVIITQSGSTVYMAGVFVLEGVNQTTPERSVTESINESSSTPASITVTGGNSAVGDMIIVVGNAGGALSAPNQTDRWVQNVDSSTSGNNAASQTAAGSASNVVLSWTVAGPDSWRCVAASVQPA